MLEEIPGWVALLAALPPSYQVVQALQFGPMKLALREQDREAVLPQEKLESERLMG